MKFAGTVVLYNPEREVIDNMQTYLSFIETLYVIDNSTKDYEFLDDIKQLEKVKYISLEGNKGIAKALKVATEKAVDEGFDFLLSMDQDSKFPTEDFKYIEEYINENNVENVGIIGINFNGNNILADSDDKTQVIEVNELITSGSFVNLHNYKKVEGYNEELFIDFVDDDICYQMKLKNFEVLLFKNISLKHKIGSSKSMKFLWIKRNILVHSPIRYYYMYRNYNYLLRNKSKDYVSLLTKKSNKFTFKHFIKRIVFDNNRIKNLKMIIRGIRDGKKGILGPYQERRK